MPWTALAIVGSSLLGAKASKDAGKGQARSADAATQLQNQQFQTVRQDNQRTREIGTGAQNMLAQLLGLNVPMDTSESNFDGAAYLAANPDVAAAGFDPYQHFQQYGKNENRQGNFFRNTGTGPTAGGDFGSLLKRFAPSDLASDPGYQFQLQEGMKAQTRRGAATNNLYSGAQLRAEQRYGQGLASTTFNDAFNRNQTESNNIFNRLTGVQNAGQVAQNNVNQAGMNFANNAGNNMMGAANARAAGTVGATNALTGGLGQWLNYTQNQDWMKKLPGGGSGGMSNSALDSYINGLG